MRELKMIFLLLITITFGIPTSCGDPDDPELQLKGAYLGQEPPGVSPQIFAPGFVSTEESVEFSSTFTPDGSEFYFSRRESGGQNQLLFSKLQDNVWANPTKVDFVENYDASEANISPDGNTIFLGSREEASSNSTVWYAERMGPTWGDIKRLENHMMYASISSNNRLYYTDISSGNISEALLMQAQFDGVGLINISQVEIGGESRPGRAHPFIARDGSFLIFNQSGDLYVTFRGDDNSWLAAKKLNTEINTSSYEFAPSVSPDGKYLFFTRDDKILWVSSEVINE